MKTVRNDCKYYKGHIPCIYHKREGVHCTNCNYYKKIKMRILIIKLGAIGDVIRTTPLLTRIRKDYPNAEITWLSYSPEIVPNSLVDNVIGFTLPNITWLEKQEVDWLINLDKDCEAIALAKSIKAKRKSGFTMDKFGKCVPHRGKAEKKKWLTGLWDDVNRENSKSYMDEIFEICGYKFRGEEYILDTDQVEKISNTNSDKIIVGLNTGCGSRWLTRLWPDSSWIELARTLRENKYEAIVLGGDIEHKKNKIISECSGARYVETPSLNEFIRIVQKLDIMVTQVTMGMHVAIALKKYLVLMNNIFNKNEFYLYNRGVILEPKLSCLGCFKQRYDEKCMSDNCMKLISVEDVMNKIKAFSQDIGIGLDT